MQYIVCVNLYLLTLIAQFYHHMKKKNLSNTVYKLFIH